MAKIYNFWPQKNIKKPLFFGINPNSESRLLAGGYCEESDDEVSGSGGYCQHRLQTLRHWSRWLRDEGGVYTGEQEEILIVRCDIVAMDEFRYAWKCFDCRSQKRWVPLRSGPCSKSSIQTKMEDWARRNSRNSWAENKFYFVPCL